MSTFSEHHCQLCSLRGRHPYRNLCQGCASLIKPRKTKNTELPAMPHIDQMVYATQYQGVAQSMVQQLKLNRHSILPTMSDLLCEAITSEVDLIHPWQLLPVPSSAWRRLQRGYEPSHLIAKSLSDSLSLPLLPEIIHANAQLSKQKTLNRRERLKQAKSAFSLKAKPYDNTGNKPTHIAIIDDVITTGSTTNAIAELLKHQYGPAIKIEAWSIAYTPQSKP